MSAFKAHVAERMLYFVVAWSPMHSFDLIGGASCSNLCSAGCGSMQQQDTRPMLPKTDITQESSSTSMGQQENIPVAVLPSLVRLNSSDSVITFCCASSSAIVNPFAAPSMPPVPPPSPQPPDAAPSSRRGRELGFGRRYFHATGRSAPALHSTLASPASADMSNEASMHHSQHSMPLCTPWITLTENLGVAAAAAHHAEAGVCPVVLAPIIAEYVIAEFGSRSPMLLEDSPGVAGILSSSCSQ
jgi:hypothetical protein